MKEENSNRKVINLNSILLNLAKFGAGYAIGFYTKPIIGKIKSLKNVGPSKKGINSTDKK